MSDEVQYVLVWPVKPFRILEKFAAPFLAYSSPKTTTEFQGIDNPGLSGPGAVAPRQELCRRNLNHIL